MVRESSARSVPGECGTAQPAGAAPLKEANLQIDDFYGPATLIAGVSGTYEVQVENSGDGPASLELFIIFTGAIEQTGRIVAPGLDCEVRHDEGINGAVRCTKPVFEPGEQVSVFVQGRGQAAGTGKIGAVLNPHRSAAEADYDDNNETRTVTIQ